MAMEVCWGMLTLRNFSSGFNNIFISIIWGNQVGQVCGYPWERRASNRNSSIRLFLDHERMLNKPFGCNKDWNKKENCKTVHWFLECMFILARLKRDASIDNKRQTSLWRKRLWFIHFHSQLTQVSCDFNKVLYFSYKKVDLLSS